MLKTLNRTTLVKKYNILKGKLVFLIIFCIKFHNNRILSALLWLIETYNFSALQKRILEIVTQQLIITIMTMINKPHESL